MKTLIKATVIGAATSFAFAIPANALIVDFTDDSYFNLNNPYSFDNSDSPAINPGTGGVDLGPVLMSLTGIPQDPDAQELYDGGAPATLHNGHELASELDGFGVGKDDEVGGSSESFSINFHNEGANPGDLGTSRNMWVSDIFLLDMFNEGVTGETANIAFKRDGADAGNLTVSKNGAGASVVTGSLFDTEGTEFFAGTANVGALLVEGGIGGFIHLSLSEIIGDFQFSFNELIFNAPDDGVSDFAVAGLRIADVNFVPVPAALPLALTGLAGLAFLGRRRKSI